MSEMTCGFNSRPVHPFALLALPRVNANTVCNTAVQRMACQPLCDINGNASVTGGAAKVLPPKQRCLDFARHDTQKRSFRLPAIASWRRRELKRGISLAADKSRYKRNRIHTPYN